MPWTLHTASRCQSLHLASTRFTNGPPQPSSRCTTLAYFILQTIKYIFGRNTRAAHDPCLNRIFQFHDHPALPFRLLLQESLRKNKIG
jgi:hypothetical protein